jgi:hypothetical protein
MPMKMCVSDLRRRQLYFNEGVSEIAPALPQRTFENLLYTIRTQGLSHTKSTR